MTAVEAREPRKVRRARTRAAYWARLRSAARTPADRANVDLQQFRAAMARPEVNERQRDRAWSEVSALLTRLTATVTPRNLTEATSQPNFTARDAPNAQTGTHARARESHRDDYSKSPGGNA